MSNLFRSFIRSSSFLAKEFYEVLRQPRLILSLVLGPFLILFLFGIGYRDQQRIPRTIIVVPANAPISEADISKYSASMKDLLNIVQINNNLNASLAKLHQGQVDLVIAEPQAAFDMIKNNHQAVFDIYHNEIDPVQVDYIDYLGWLFTNVVNQQVLENFVAQAQKDSSTMHDDLQRAHQNVQATKQAVQSGDAVSTQQQAATLTTNLEAVTLLAGGSLGMMDSYQASSSNANTNNGPATSNVVADINNNVAAVNNPATPAPEKLSRLDKIDQDLTQLDNKLSLFQDLQPNVIVTPFTHDTESVANYQPTLLSFFVPAVLALLLQHIAVTFAALSIVRERNVGTVELFKISPISAAEALFGKYISYMIFGGVIAAALALLLTKVLNIPMIGSWWNYALVVAAILFTSLGYGFVISMVSQSDSQAVQYSMILLLASVFFSGFIMGLEKLWAPIKIVSWLLPTTYGTVMLRNIALRGYAPDLTLLAGLIGLGLFLLIVANILMRRLIGTSAWAK